MKVFGKKIDRLLIASVILHLLVLGGAMVSVSSRAFVPPPEDAVPVEIVTASQMTQIMQGTKTGQKDNPKPKVDKVAEAKPFDDEAVGKLDDKKPPIKTSVAPEPPPKPEKVEEKKPDPPKPVVKNEPKPEKKPEPKKDEVGDLINDTAKKPPPPKPQPPKQEVAKVTPPPKPKQERSLDDELQKMALVDKRDPTRNSITGAAVNQKAAVGTAKGQAADNSGTWGTMFKQQVARCWNKPYGGIDAEKLEGVFSIRLKRDGTLEAPPVVLPENSKTPFARIFLESASRAIVECQPYNLPPVYFEEWKFFEPVFPYRDAA